jgi:hypothetical protein
MESKTIRGAFARGAAKLAVAVFLSAGILAVASCYYMPALSGGGAARAAVSVSRALPVDIASVALIVGGPGMDTITDAFAAGTTGATLTIPSGAGRTFTLLVNTPSATLIGTSTVDLAPGETKDITVSPVLSGTQIIVPDLGNGRLVQIADMKGTGLTTFADLVNAPNPYDVDFDDQGRIYVASSSFSADGVFRIDDINGGNYTHIAGNVNSTVQSIAMDRTRGLLYYVEGSSLYKIQVTPTVGVEQPPLMSFETVKAIAVDADGFVYVVCYSSPSDIVEKIDPNAASVVANSSASFTFSNPWDVLVNGDYVYVSDNGARQIVRLTKNLQFVDSFPGPVGDNFVGPEQFVAIPNHPITVIDETPYSAQGNRIVSFNDMTGAGWTVYEPQTSGQDDFVFYWSNLPS